jgi:tRNA (guanine-N7-)-methyltransferase
MDEYGLTNLRLVEEDARVLLDHFFPKASLDVVHLYFPDPWPKKKHWKRRIVQDDFIATIAAALKPGGYIHIATDWVPYAEWIEEKFGASELFTGGVIPKPEFRPLTRFEGQGIRKGHEVRDLKYFKL